MMNKQMTNERADGWSSKKQLSFRRKIKHAAVTNPESRCFPNPIRVQKI